VIKTEQVQDAVDQKLVEAGFKRNTDPFGFSSCRVQRYDHISQKVRIELLEPALLHGEGKHIGRLGPMQESLVEFGYFLIIYNKDGQLALTTFQGV